MNTNESFLKKKSDLLSLFFFIFLISSSFYQINLNLYFTYIPEYHRNITIFASILTFISALIFIVYIPYKLLNQKNTTYLTIISLASIIIGLFSLPMIFWMISALVFIVYISYKLLNQKNTTYLTIISGLSIFIGLYWLGSIYWIMTDYNTEGDLFKKIDCPEYNKSVYIFKIHRGAFSNRTLLILETQKNTSTDFSIYTQRHGDNRLDLESTLSGVDIKSIEVREKKYLMISLNLIENNIQELVLGNNIRSYRTGYDKNYYCLDLEKNRPCNLN